VISRDTELDDLDSAIEALCVRPRGVEARALFRSLVTTRPNCAISEGGNYDKILARFTDVSLTACNALCESIGDGNDPGIDECIDQLDCFNRGVVVVDGDCVLGTCEDDPEKPCGADLGPCDEGDCDRFEAAQSIACARQTSIRRRRSVLAG
jgi:hypothetical protein